MKNAEIPVYENKFGWNFVKQYLVLILKEPFLRVFRLQIRKRRSEPLLGEQLSNDIHLDKQKLTKLTKLAQN